MRLPPRLTTAFLKRLGACEHGAYEFERTYPKGTHITAPVVGNFSVQQLTWFACRIRMGLIHSGRHSALIKRWGNARRRIETLGPWNEAAARDFAKVYADTVRATNSPAVIARERKRIKDEERSLAKLKASYRRLDKAWREARHRQRGLYDQRIKASEKLRALGWEP
jgi:hypothetical protein